MAGGNRAAVGRDDAAIPAQRPVPRHFSQPQPLRLPPVEDHLDDVRHKACEGQESSEG